MIRNSFSSDGILAREEMEDLLFDKSEIPYIAETVEVEFQSDHSLQNVEIIPLGEAEILSESSDEEYTEDLEETVEVEADENNNGNNGGAAAAAVPPGGHVEGAMEVLEVIQSENLPEDPSCLLQVCPEDLPDPGDLEEGRPEDLPEIPPEVLAEVSQVFLQVSQEDLHSGAEALQISPAVPKVSPEDLQISSEDPQISPEDPKISPEDPKISLQDLQISPEDQQISLEIPKVSPEDQQNSPKVLQTGPEVTVEVPPEYLPGSPEALLLCPEVLPELSPEVLQVPAERLKISPEVIPGAPPKTVKVPQENLPIPPEVPQTFPQVIPEESPKVPCPETDFELNPTTTSKICSENLFSTNFQSKLEEIFPEAEHASEPNTKKARFSVNPEENVEIVMKIEDDDDSSCEIIAEYAPRQELLEASPSQSEVSLRSASVIQWAGNVARTKEEKVEDIPVITIDDETEPEVTVHVKHLYPSMYHVYRCICCDGLLGHRRIRRGQPSFQRHRMVDSRYRCTSCGNGYETEAQLKRHLTRHGEKRFGCCKCDKKFCTHRELQSHAVVHTTDRPFQCPHCSVTFRQSSSYYSHLKGHIICEICSAEGFRG